VASVSDTDWECLQTKLLYNGETDALSRDVYGTDKVSCTVQCDSNICNDCGGILDVFTEKDFSYP